MPHGRGGENGDGDAHLASGRRDRLRIRAIADDGDQPGIAVGERARGAHQGGQTLGRKPGEGDHDGDAAELLDEEGALGLRDLTARAPARAGRLAGVVGVLAGHGRTRPKRRRRPGDR